MWRDGASVSLPGPMSSCIGSPLATSLQMLLAQLARWPWSIFDLFFCTFIRRTDGRRSQKQSQHRFQVRLSSLVPPAPSLVDLKPTPIVSKRILASGFSLLRLATNLYTGDAPVLFLPPWIYLLITISLTWPYWLWLFVINVDYSPTESRLHYVPDQFPRHLLLVSLITATWFVDLSAPVLLRGAFYFFHARAV